MGDVYRCKNCGQLLYGAVVPEINGDRAGRILQTLERVGYYDSAQPVAFLESDFSDFLTYVRTENGYRYTAEPNFANVMKNMRADDVVIGTKVYEDDRDAMVCPICHSHTMFHTLGDLPTTFIDGRWEDFVESDHTWYILSDNPSGIGSMTGLERRELEKFISAENRFDAQSRFHELIEETHKKVRTEPGGFVSQKDLNLIDYFKVLLNIKTDIQLLEMRLYDLILEKIESDRAFVNSISRSEETVLTEIRKVKMSVQEKIELFKQELMFRMRDGWEEEYGLVYPTKPVRVELEEPQEPEYLVPGLFNRRQVREENEALKAEYDVRLKEYWLRIKEMEDADAAYEKAVEDYNHRREELLHEKEEEWNNLEETRTRREQLEELEAQLEDLKAQEDNPTEIAENTLSNSSPKRVKEMIDNEIECNKEHLVKAYQTEANLQTLMFVLPKYLDVLAVSRIYEYLSTGKCTQLTGTNGAYRMYEMEMRSNRFSALSRAASIKNDVVRREFTIYNMLSSVSSIMADLTEKTSAALEEIRTTTYSAATEAYEQAMDSYYQLIDQELAICDAFLLLHKKAAPEPPVEEPAPEETKKAEEAKEPEAESSETDTTKETEASERVPTLEEPVSEPVQEEEVSLADILAQAETVPESVKEPESEPVPAEEVESEPESTGDEVKEGETETETPSSEVKEAHETSSFQEVEGHVEIISESSEDVFAQEPKKEETEEPEVTVTDNTEADTAL